MSVYKTYLPRAFPIVYVGGPADVKVLVNRLISEYRSDVPQGSSFAVTVDNWDGTWNLWLSKASAAFLGVEGR